MPFKTTHFKGSQHLFTFLCQTSLYLSLDHHPVNPNQTKPEKEKKMLDH